MTSLLPLLDDLKTALSYDPNTGNFCWLKSLSNAAQAGSHAGSKNDRGYVFIRFQGRHLRAHRLAWLFMTGLDPGRMEIDHIDRNPSNNAWANLRLATRKQNSENTSTQSNNTSGVRGVYFHKNAKTWDAYIYHHKRRIHLGCFQDREQAIAARVSAQEKLFTHIGGIGAAP